MIHKTENNNFLIDDSFYDFDDIQNLFRLQKELFEKENIIATIEECINIWQTYSSDLCASWLFFPEKNIVEMIKSSRYFTSFDEYSK
jgi:hypothetical protein